MVIRDAKQATGAIFVCCMQAAVVVPGEGVKEVEF
jgi:hypothetical protein